MIARALTDLARKRPCICAGKSAVACPIDAVAAPGSENVAQLPWSAHAARLREATPHSRIPEPDQIALP